jgi:hypothetical protein
MRQNSKIRHSSEQGYDDEGAHNSFGIAMLIAFGFACVLIGIAKLAGSFA